MISRVKVKVKSLSRVRLFVTPWTVAYQAPPSMRFSRQEYWSGLLFPFPGLYILSPCLFNLYADHIMQNAGLDETQAESKIAGENISNLRYADDPTLWQ